jgi:hypothetical protein
MPSSKEHFYLVTGAAIARIITWNESISRASPEKLLFTGLIGSQTILNKLFKFISQKNRRVKDKLLKPLVKYTLE